MDTDLGHTIARLQAYQEAGADVLLYAPGLSRLEDIRQLVSSVDRPVNVLARPGAPSVTELAAIGVKRVSVGGAFACVPGASQAKLAITAADPHGTGPRRLWKMLY